MKLPLTKRKIKTPPWLKKEKVLRDLAVEGPLPLDLPGELPDAPPAPEPLDVELLELTAEEPTEAGPAALFLSDLATTEEATVSLFVLAYQV